MSDDFPQSASIIGQLGYLDNNGLRAVRDAAAKRLANRVIDEYAPAEPSIYQRIDAIESELTALHQRITHQRNLSEKNDKMRVDRFCRIESDINDVKGRIERVDQSVSNFAVTVMTAIDGAAKDIAELRGDNLGIRLGGFAEIDDDDEYDYGYDEEVGTAYDPDLGLDLGPAPDDEPQSDLRYDAKRGVFIPVADGVVEVGPVKTVAILSGILHTGDEITVTIEVESA